MVPVKNWVVFSARKFHNYYDLLPKDDLKIYKKLKAKWQTSDQCLKIKPVFSGHLVRADTFHGQSLIEKPLYSGHFYSGHNFLAPGEKFKLNLLLYSGHIFSLGK